MPEGQSKAHRIARLARSLCGSPLSWPYNPFVKIAQTLSPARIHHLNERDSAFEMRAEVN